MGLPVLYTLFLYKKINALFLNKFFIFGFFTYNFLGQNEKTFIYTDSKHLDSINILNFNYFRLQFYKGTPRALYLMDEPVESKYSFFFLFWLVMLALPFILVGGEVKVNIYAKGFLFFFTFIRVLSFVFNIRMFWLVNSVIFSLFSSNCLYDVTFF